MATDSTELTFVRCPSCRSLVPAVSTRCRMCGATLDNGADVASGQESGGQKSGRVRQRTISQSKNELTQAANRIRSEHEVDSDQSGIESKALESKGDSATREATEAVLAAAADLEPAAKAGATPSSADKGDEEFDPLSGYVEEVALDDDSLDEGLDDFDQDEDDDLLDDMLEEPSPSAAAKAKEAGATAKAAVVAEPLDKLSKEEEKVSPPLNGRGAASKAQSSESKVRVRGESVSKTGPLSISPKPKWEEPMKDAKEISRESDDRRRDEARTSSTSANARPTAVRPPVIGNTGAAASGRLAGWFVNFSNPTGVSTELREGKFFVSRTQLKPTDYVIDDSSVSTPHALVSVTLGKSGAGVVQAQDLLSEKGVMVRHRGQANFQKVQDSAELGHGDAIRFGEVEFRVYLISE